MRRVVFAVVTTASALAIVVACGDDNKGAVGTVADAGLADASPPVFRPSGEAGDIQAIRFGEAGAPTTCPAKPSPDTALVRACVLRSACIPDQPPYKLSDCITYDLINGEDDVDCVRKAKTCEEMDACFDQGFFYGKDCEPGDYGYHCYGDRLVSCTSNSALRSYYDCDKVGKQCEADEPGDGSATKYSDCRGLIHLEEPGCPQENRTGYATRTFQTCEALTSDPTFTYVQYCQFGQLNAQVCKPSGKVCVDFATGPECRKPAPACGDAGTSCSGSVLSRCNTNRRETHDCAEQGLNCVTENGKADCVLPSCTQTTSHECTESCDGPFANVCVGGGRLTIDCRDYGFTRCQAYTSADTRNYGDTAVCVYF